MSCTNKSHKAKAPAPKKVPVRKRKYTAKRKKS